LLVSPSQEEGIQKQKTTMTGDSRRQRRRLCCRSRERLERPMSGAAYGRSHCKGLSYTYPLWVYICIIHGELMVTIPHVRLLSRSCGTNNTRFARRLAEAPVSMILNDEIRSERAKPVGPESCAKARRAHKNLRKSQVPLVP
jgi:hypothetical protein